MWEIELLKVSCSLAEKKPKKFSTDFFPEPKVKSSDCLFCPTNSHNLKYIKFILKQRKSAHLHILEDGISINLGFFQDEWHKLSINKSFHNRSPLIFSGSPKCLFGLSGRSCFLLSENATPAFDVLFACSPQHCSHSSYIQSHTHTHTQLKHTLPPCSRNKQGCIFSACLFPVIWWVCCKPHEATLASSASWLCFCLPVLTAGNFPVAAGTLNGWLDVWLNGCLADLKGTFRPYAATKCPQLTVIGRLRSLPAPSPKKTFRNIYGKEQLVPVKTVGSLGECVREN